ncbi:galactan beta-1,4-galactosyltransferase GALS1 isoform X1 [Physcomitrium patens]|uniref:Glycosyltransferase family 92 protein n=2 Tax=Physcomitrium patens TaxID=3218 RepID=A0A2K1L809_PHYPA|nr:galactan beta-1,4-galactosyltransferase GALS1-like isoform X1 [Physcomitrium patens]PNR62142.1 hypothetical protein PHYPA_000566 [Physcomitrium patens]|eukprot:XP_024366071.1 galactan beta-1,4-galactosyltransferase GALS1-like isoform X1 [Physcomitrella patens]
MAKRIGGSDREKVFEKVFGIRLLVSVCLLLSFAVILLRFKSPQDNYLGFGSIQGSQAKYSEPKVVKEWQLPSIVADRAAEKLNDSSYGLPRRFLPMGTATFLFVHFSTYRVAPKSFATIGLGPKALFLYSNPAFFCSWHPAKEAAPVIKTNGTFLQPVPTHVSYGKQYTGTAVYCNFDTPIGNDGSGGRLEIQVTHGTQDASGLEDVNFVAKEEGAGEFNASLYQEPYQYDHVYCGAPIYGSINAQRIREWIAYHVWFFGERTHFYLYDAGGFDEQVRAVLQPWVKLGVVIIMNIRQEARFNSHYHNQFVILNDCLFRAKSMAKWTWFFDVDEYIHRPAGSNLNEVIKRIETENFWGKRLQRVSIKQMSMDYSHCLRGSQPNSNEWGISKMVYRKTDVGEYPDRKNFVLSDSCLATGPHEPMAMSMPPGANQTHHVTKWEGELLQYYHFHGAIGKAEGEICVDLLDPDVNVTSFNNVTHQFDDALKSLVDDVMAFEHRMINQATHTS